METVVFTPNLGYIPVAALNLVLTDEKTAPPRFEEPFVTAEPLELAKTPLDDEEDEDDVEDDDDDEDEDLEDDDDLEDEDDDEDLEDDEDDDDEDDEDDAVEDDDPKPLRVKSRM